MIGLTRRTFKKGKNIFLLKRAGTQPFRLISENIRSKDDELAGIFEIYEMIGAILAKLFLNSFQYDSAPGP